MAACSRMNKVLYLHEYILFFETLAAFNPVFIVVLFLQVNIHVYEADRRSGGYRRISCFDHPQAHHTIHVLYRGACHYDALVPSR
jgi:hypothetical protein